MLRPLLLPSIVETWRAIFTAVGGESKMLSTQDARSCQPGPRIRANRLAGTVDNGLLKVFVEDISLDS